MFGLRELDTGVCLNLFHVGREKCMVIRVCASQLGSAFGGDYFSIGDTEESKHGAQVRRYEIKGSHCGIGSIGTTAGDQKRNFLSLQQTFGAVWTVGKGLANTSDLVDPEFQGGRNTKVVHGDAKDIFVGLL